MPCFAAGASALVGAAARGARAGAVAGAGGEEEGCTVGL